MTDSMTSSEVLSTFALDAIGAMCDMNTPESFRVRYAHSEILLNELKLVSELNVGSPVWSKHFEYVKDELFDVYEHEKLVIGSVLTERLLMEQLRREKDLRVVIRACERSKDLPYMWGSCAVEKIGTWTDPKRKKDLLMLIGIALSELQARHQIDALDLSSCSTLNGLAGMLDEALSGAHPGIYEVHVPVRSAQAEHSLSECRQKLQAIFNGQTIEVDEGSQLIWIRVDEKVLGDADTLYSIAQRAVSGVRRGCGLLSFYLPKMLVRVENTPKIGVKGKNSLRSVSIEGAEEPVKWSRKNATRLVSRVLRGSNLDIDERLWSSLEQYSAARASRDVRARLVGVWSALETLVGSAWDGSVLERVKRVVIPAILLRRTDRIVRYLSIRLHESGLFSRLSDEQRGLFPACSERAINPHEIFMALCGPNKSSGILALLAAVDGDWLRYQVYSMWGECCSREALLKRLGRSERHVGYNVARIYRARNLLVHQGRDYPGIEVLSRHLDGYFHETLNAVLYSYSGSRRR